MQIEHHHDLHFEFPELGDKIHQMKMSNAHFSRLFEDYHHQTAAIEELEGNDVPVDDSALEVMKKNRLKLKDELYKMLTGQ